VCIASSKRKSYFYALCQKTSRSSSLRGKNKKSSTLKEMKKKPLSLAKALRLNAISPKHIAFVGAGGKTSALFDVAREIAPCIVTTTTHLGAWQAKEADQHIIIRETEDVNQFENIPLSGVILVTGGEKDNRLQSLTEKNLAWLRSFADYHSLSILIEADGARKKPLKAPKADEPVIPDFVDMVVVVAGLSGLGKKLSEESVYNAGKFAKLGKVNEGEKITPDNLTRVLAHKESGLKNIPAKARKIALLNQADTAKQKLLAEKWQKTCYVNLTLFSLPTCNLQLITCKLLNPPLPSSSRREHHPVLERRNNCSIITGFPSFARWRKKLCKRV